MLFDMSALCIGLGIGLPQSVTGEVSVPANTAVPNISWDEIGKVDSVASSDTGTWTGSPSAFEYRWFKDGIPLAGATSSSFTFTVETAGLQVSVRVRAQNAAGWSDWVASAAVTPVALESPTNTAAPEITASGSTVWATLTLTSAGSWTGNPTPGLDRQWYFNGSPILGETSDSITASAAGDYHCAVTAINVQGDAGPVNSNTMSISEP